MKPYRHPMPSRADEEPIELLASGSAKADALLANRFPDQLDLAPNRRTRERFPVRIDPEMKCKTDVLWCKEA